MRLVRRGKKKKSIRLQAAVGETGRSGFLLRSVNAGVSEGRSRLEADGSGPDASDDGAGAAGRTRSLCRGRRKSLWS